MLFRSPLLSTAPAAAGRPPPVLMEAFHAFFVPAWRVFLSLVDRPSLAHVHARAVIPSFIAKDDDIRFDYGLAGGSAMDVGTYTVMAVRKTLGAEPEECVRADLTPMAPPRERCDGMFHAQFRFPGDVVGEVEGGLRGSNFSLSWPTLTVQHRAVPIEGDGDGSGDTEVRRTRKVVFVNFMFAPVYHRIEVLDEFVVTRKGSGEEVKRYRKKETRKAYSFREMGDDEPGEPYWSTYRYELEQFVNRIRGRRENGTFIEHEDSIAQMRALDMIYEKSGLGLRPTSEYRP
jgi:predicted dehydrogenase